jgi:hypothetical protein
VPHNYLKIPLGPPNPGRWTRDSVDDIVKRHHGTLEFLWVDDPDDPTHAYALVRDGNVDGLLDDLHARELTRLHETS